MKRRKQAAGGMPLGIIRSLYFSFAVKPKIEETVKNYCCGITNNEPRSSPDSPCLVGYLKTRIIHKSCTTGPKMVK